MPQESQQALMWKKKYFSTLEKLEELEKQSADSDTLFRRSLLRLSLILDGFDPKLDQQLEKLREDIRKGRKALNIGQFTEETCNQAEQIIQRIQAQPQAHQLLLKLVTQLKLPDTLKKQKKEQESLKTALNKRHAEDKIEQHLEKFLQLLQDLQAYAKLPEEHKPLSNDIDSNQTDTTQGGLFRRLFARPTTPTETDKSHNECVAETIKQLLQALSPTQSLEDKLHGIAHQLNSPLNRQEINRLIAQLAEILSLQTEECSHPSLEAEKPATLLIKLVEQITLTEPYAEELQNLRDEIEQHHSSEDINSFLERLGILISRAQSISQNEKEELEGFLLHITETLSEIDENIRGNQDRQRAALKSSQLLDEAVRDHVQGIQSSMLEASDLKELKHNIQARLATIRDKVKIFREESDERHQRMEQAMENLAGKVTRIESESEKLRSSLEQQRNKAMRDTLTGVNNRLAYEEFLEHEYSRWKRNHHALTLIVWDIDNFKMVNDRFGHQAGDKALRLVAQILKRRLRDSDYLARYGGEEFVSLLPDSNIQDALKLAEKLREIIASSEFHYHDERVNLTISCGLAQFHKDDTPHTVFQRADAALYEAKANGRNRCETEPKHQTPALGGHD